MEEKQICRSCGIEYPKTGAYFYGRRKKGVYTLDTKCKTCLARANSDYQTMRNTGAEKGARVNKKDSQVIVDITKEMTSKKNKKALFADNFVVLIAFHKANDFVVGINSIDTDSLNGLSATEKKIFIEMISNAQDGINKLKNIMKENK